MTDERFDTAWKSFCEKRRGEIADALLLSDQQIEDAVRDAEGRMEIQRQQRREEKLVWLGALTALAATVVFAILLYPTLENSRVDPISLSDVWYWEVSPQ